MVLHLPYEKMEAILYFYKNDEQQFFCEVFVAHYIASPFGLFAFNDRPRDKCFREGEMNFFLSSPQQLFYNTKEYKCKGNIKDLSVFRGSASGAKSAPFNHNENML